MSQSIESMIEVLQAYKDGKKIEYLNNMDGTWSKCGAPPIWAFDTNQYRIAPEQKKMVKFAAWLSPTGQLIWYDTSKVISTDCIRVPSEDKEILL